VLASGGYVILREEQSSHPSYLPLALFSYIHILTTGQSVWTLTPRVLRVSPAWPLQKVRNVLASFFSVKAPEPTAVHVPQPVTDQPPYNQSESWKYKADEIARKIGSAAREEAIKVPYFPDLRPAQVRFGKKGFGTGLELAIYNKGAKEISGVPEVQVRAHVYKALGNEATILCDKSKQLRNESLSSATRSVLTGMAFALGDVRAETVRDIVVAPSHIGKHMDGWIRLCIAQKLVKTASDSLYVDALIDAIHSESTDQFYSHFGNRHQPRSTDAP
jgi:hypothetical protein